jgi:glycine/serine hydroxymethyltransferase
MSDAEAATDDALLDAVRANAAAAKQAADKEIASTATQFAAAAKDLAEAFQALGYKAG